MKHRNDKTFVGFGFGPIQSALFLYEAYVSKAFARFVVSEIDVDLVKAIRDNGGRYTINIARKDRVDQYTLEGIEMLNPLDEADREAIIAAVSASDEMATALPSVNIYSAGGENSVASLIGAGLNKRCELVPTIIYAAENNNHAAEILHENLERVTGLGWLESVQILDTVIGKMSGVITEADVIERMGLATITPDIGRAVLVEEFNQILISDVELEECDRGIDVFVEKDDLMPFEEAKLYGHNAVHALIGYLAEMKGYNTMAEAGHDDVIMDIARQAFIDESGKALIKRHSMLDEPLFTQEGYREYVDDLLERMVNPNLNDLVSRVGRDHIRKLGYDDRLFGTMRIALDNKIEPTNLAMGAAAGIRSMIARQDELAGQRQLEHMPKSVEGMTEDDMSDMLHEIWDGKRKLDMHSGELIGLTWRAMDALFEEGIV